ncbi:cation transporter [Corynebacterium sp. 335C]
MSAASPAASAGPSGEARRLTRVALGLALFTIAYNVAEGALSVWFGRGDGLSVMVGFGLDSFIESLFAVLVALRLAGRLRGDGGGAGEIRERRTLRAVAVTFWLLAAWLVWEGVSGLVVGEVPERSWPSVAVLVASLAGMPVLWRAKVTVGRRLGGDPLILSDAAETRICLLMTGSALIGIVAFELTGWGGFASLASLAIAVIAVQEGREAWEGELAEEDGDDG